MPYVLFISLCAIWGTNFILMKKAGLWFSPLSVGALRVVGGALILGVVFAMRGCHWPLRREHIGALLFVVLLGYCWPFAIQPYLVEFCGSGFIGMMVTFVPLLTIMVSIPMLGVYPSPRQLVGVIGGLGFLILILADGIDREIKFVHILLAITVPLSYAICNTFIRRRFVGIAPLPLAFCCLAMSTVFLLPAAVANPIQAGADPEQLPRAIGCVALLGVVGTGLGALAFTKMLQDHGPLFASMVTYLIPAFALAWGWADGESITSLQIGALAGVLCMVALVQFGTARRTQSGAT